VKAVAQKSWSSDVTSEQTDLLSVSVQNNHHAYQPDSATSNLRQECANYTPTIWQRYASTV
ncbi:MAG: hypothetical protein AAF512_21015, partial [Pseudomonadota bacterium]